MRDLIIFDSNELVKILTSFKWQEQTSLSCLSKCSQFLESPSLNVVIQTSPNTTFMPTTVNHGCFRIWIIGNVDKLLTFFCPYISLCRVKRLLLARINNRRHFWTRENQHEVLLWWNNCLSKFDRLCKFFRIDR